MLFDKRKPYILRKMKESPLSQRLLFDLFILSIFSIVCLIGFARLDFSTHLTHIFSQSGLWEGGDFFLIYFICMVPILWFSGRRWIDANNERRKRKVAELKLARGREEIYRANQTCSHFLSNMSHELRTPLNAVIGFSHIIQDEMYGPVGVEIYRDYAKDIHDSGNILLGLVNDLLDLSRIEEGIYELHPSNLDVGKIVQKLDRLLTEVFRKHDLSFKAHIEKDLPPLFGDEKAITQIFYNLLSNAIKFSREGGKVWLDIRVVQSQMVIIIGDSGPGISSMTRKYFFEPFNRFHEKYQTRENNLGLGLMVVKTLLDMHGAHIDIASSAGKGTQVILKFALQGIEHFPYAAYGEDKIIDLASRRQRNQQQKH